MGGGGGGLLIGLRIRGGEGGRAICEYEAESRICPFSRHYDTELRSTHAGVGKRYTERKMGIFRRECTMENGRNRWTSQEEGKYMYIFTFSSLWKW